MRTSHKAKDAAAEKQSYACDTFTGHGKAHQPPPPGSPVRVFPVMLLGKADEGAAIDLVRGRGDDASGPAAGSSVNRGPSGAGLRSGLDFGESGGLQRHLRQAVGPHSGTGDVSAAGSRRGILCSPGLAGPLHIRTGVLTRLPLIAMRGEIRKARLRFAFGRAATARCREPGSPDLADLRAATNAPGPARSRSESAIWVV
jgi:hypothetical protein